MKLAPKLTLFLVGVMILVLAGDAYVGIRRETTLLESDMLTDEKDVGRALGSVIGQVWRNDGREQALNVIADADRSSGRIRVRWVDVGVEAAAARSPRTPNATARILQGEVFTLVDRSVAPYGRLYTYVPVPEKGTVLGALELSESLDDEHRYLRTLVEQRIVTAGALALLFAMLAGILGDRLVGQPIQVLVEKARRVGAGDFGHPLALQRGDEIGALGVEIDVMCDRLAAASERIRTETAARIAALEQLRHADRLATVGQLAAGVAHELGTPLNVVSQRAKMIAVGEVQGPQAADGARIVYEQSQRITAIIRQLLDFARRRAPQKAPQDLRGLIEQTVAFLAPLARKRSVTVRVEAEVPFVSDVDAGQMQQVLTNLMVNGIQAMPQGGELRVVARRTHATPPAGHEGQAGEWLCLAIQDQGIGIPPENQQRLFEPFFTTKDVGEGTGLGLAVAYGIVREHKGWIDVHSEVGKGSRFSIYLPAETQEAEV